MKFRHPCIVVSAKLLLPGLCQYYFIKKIEEEKGADGVDKKPRFRKLNTCHLKMPVVKGAMAGECHPVGWSLTFNRSVCVHWGRRKGR